MSVETDTPIERELRDAVQQPAPTNGAKKQPSYWQTPEGRARMSRQMKRIHRLKPKWRGTSIAKRAPLGFKRSGAGHWTKTAKGRAHMKKMQALAMKKRLATKRDRPVHPMKGKKYLKHWTQTPDGRRRVAARNRQMWAEKRGHKVPPPTMTVAETAVAGSVRDYADNGKNMRAGRSFARAIGRLPDGSLTRVQLSFRTLGDLFDALTDQRVKGFIIEEMTVEFTR